MRSITESSSPWEEDQEGVRQTLGLASRSFVYNPVGEQHRRLTVSASATMNNLDGRTPAISSRGRQSQRTLTITMTVPINDHRPVFEERMNQAPHSDVGLHALYHSAQRAPSVFMALGPSDIEALTDRDCKNYTRLAIPLPTS